MLLGYLWTILGYRPCPPLKAEVLPDVRREQPADSDADIRRREHMVEVYSRLREKRDAATAR